MLHCRISHNMMLAASWSAAQEAYLHLWPYFFLSRTCKTKPSLHPGVPNFQTAPCTLAARWIPAYFQDSSEWDLLDARDASILDWEAWVYYTQFHSEPKTCVPIGWAEHGRAASLYLQAQHQQDHVPSAILDAMLSLDSESICASVV